MTERPRISIRGGRVIDPASGLDRVTGLHLADGRILAIGEAPDGFAPEQTIDATGLVVCPGLVDLSARPREPGQEYKATLQSETLAAARGGITTLCCPPDTDPPIDTPAMVTLVRKRAQRLGNARVLPVGALTRGLDGERLSEMASLQAAGAVALGNAERPLANTLVERRALEYAATFGIPVLLRPVDPHLHDGGCAHEGPVASRLGLPGIPGAAETVAVARDLALAEQTGCRIHFRGLSTGTAVRQLQQARDQRLAVSADVAIHQLHLTEMDLEGFDSNCHVTPPLRSLTDRDSLRDGIARGIIGAICSDHQPHDPDAKEAPFPSTAPGISGLETLLPLTLKLVDEGVLPLIDALARLTCGPADILGLPHGRLVPGGAADICLFDPERHWLLRREEMVSAGHNTPFHGWEFRGQVTHTLFEGRIVHQV
ncbi:MAG TPA: dihydroorotase [Sedimenticola thiotaurini]|uniref:Dihydroorotase n=1 Tax=Sedimenticola thiotaurini TaxID=1543721 RepID=A0A831W223_9GAMM|nr:dihydroorotase [Sedimenticola thiotaurini]